MTKDPDRHVIRALARSLSPILQHNARLLAARATDAAINGPVVVGEPITAYGYAMGNQFMATKIQ